MAFTLHLIRHTYVMRCTENNVNCVVAKGGHSTTDKTEKVYAHVNDVCEKEKLKNSIMM